METTVQLQEPFSYALWLPVLLSLIVFGYLIFLIVSKIVEKAKQREPKKAPEVKVVVPPVDIEQLKLKYIQEVNRIEAELAQGSITSRDAYQKMSMCIRSFVYEATRINVQSCTLQDIRKLNMPSLENLIAEYYIPEFAQDSVGDVSAALQKTRRAIETWN